MRSQLDEDKGEENDQQEQQERNKNYKLLCKSVWNRIGVWQQVLPDGLSIRRQKVTMRITRLFPLLLIEPSLM